MTVKGPFGVPVPQPAPPDQTKYNLDSHSHSLPTQVKTRRRALRGAPRPSLEPPLTSNTPPLPTKVKSNQSPDLSSPLLLLFPPSSPLHFFPTVGLHRPQTQPSAAPGGLSPPLLLTLHSSYTLPLMLQEPPVLSPTCSLPPPL